MGGIEKSRISPHLRQKALEPGQAARGRGIEPSVKGSAGRVNHRAQAQATLDQVLEDGPLKVVGELIGFDDQEAPRGHGPLGARDDARTKGGWADSRAGQGAGGEPVGRAPEVPGMAPVTGIPLFPDPNDVPRAEKFHQGQRLGPRIAWDWLRRGSCDLRG